MNRGPVAGLFFPGEGFTTELTRAGTSELGREMCAFANVTGRTTMLAAVAPCEMVGFAEADGRSRYG